MTPSPPLLPRLRAWLWAYPYTTAFVVASLVLAVPFCLRHDGEWEEVYVGGAAQLWQGGDLYEQPGYLYPPFMAWASLPFVPLPTLPARLVWLLINLACLAGLLRWGWRLAGGGQLEGPGRRPWPDHLLAIGGAACGLLYAGNCLAHRQTDVVLDALLAGGCLLLLRNRSLAAATCFGLAAAAKCTGLLWFPYLLWRRQPPAAAWLLCVAIGVNVLPDLAHPAPSGEFRLVQYAHRWLAPLTGRDHYVGTWGSDLVYNQSLSGAGQRWLTTTCTWAPGDCLIENRPSPPPPALLRLVVHGTELAILAVVLWVCGRPFKRIDGGREPGRLGLEASVVLLLMLLFSPMSSKAHFGILVVPGFCLACATGRSGSQLLWFVWSVAALLAPLATKDPLGERLYTLSLWTGMVTWHTLLLLAGCLLALRWEGRSTALAPSVDEGLDQAA
jgi:hypothetical protein